MPEAERIVQEMLVLVQHYNATGDEIDRTPVIDLDLAFIDPAAPREWGVLT